MKYSQIQEISIELLNNEKIPKQNLLLVYELTEKEHYTLDYELYMLMGSKGKFKHSDIIDVNVNSITFKFIQRNSKIVVE